MLAGGCQQAPETRQVRPEVVALESQQLSAWGDYERLVALETRPDVLLGTVDVIKIDPESGELLVGDFRSSKRAYRFDRDGRFLAMYGDPASENSPYFYLSDVARMPDDRILIVAGNRGLVFELDGELVDTVFFEFAPDEILTHGDRIYIRGHSKGRKILEQSVHIFDSSLKQRGSFHAYDPRRDLFGFQPKRSLGSAQGRIYVTDYYDYRVTAYDPDGNPLAVFEFDNHNAELASLWQRDRTELTSDDRTTLVQGVHRIQTLLGFGDGLYMFESNLKRGILRYSMFSPERDTLYQYPNLKLVFTGEGDGDYFAIDKIAGSYDRGLLGIVDDPERIERYRDRYPILEGVEYEVTENPIVLFFKLKFPEGAAA